MNILYVIIVFLILSVLVYGGYRLWRVSATGLGRFAAVGMVGIAAVLIIVLTNNFLFRIPNPFDLPKVVFSPSDNVNSQRPIGPLVVPPTNADPALAATHQYDLLKDSITQQQEQLHPKQ